jgi:hypothetical protein
MKGCEERCGEYSEIGRIVRKSAASKVRLEGL